MKKLNRALFAAVVTVSAGLGSLAPAKAATETWNFNSPTGTLGNTQTYPSTPDGILITASGFTTSVGGATLTTPEALFGKNCTLPCDEHGVGINSDPTGDGEIWNNPATTNGHVVELTVPTGISLTGFTFKMGSVQTGEGWAVYGSNSALTGFTLLTSGTADDTTVPIPGSFAFYYFAATAGNVLLESATGVTISTVPLPGALPLFATGLALMGLLRMRRKRSVAAV